MNLRLVCKANIIPYFMQGKVSQLLPYISLRYLVRFYDITFLYRFLPKFAPIYIVYLHRKHEINDLLDQVLILLLQLFYKLLQCILFTLG